MALSVSKSNPSPTTQTTKNTMSSSIKPTTFIKKHGKSSAGPVIVQVLPEMHRGGVERGTIEMAEAIIAAGGRAVVISNGGGMVRHLLRCGATHHELPVHAKNPLKWGAIRRKVQRILIAEGADIVHVRSRVPAWIALPAAKALGLISVSTIHGRFQATSALKRHYNGKLLKSDHVIAISKYVKSLITKQYHGVEENLTVIPRGVDVDVFDPNQVSQSRVVRFVDGNALPDDVPVVMLPARPSLWKGHGILLEALAKIADLPFVCVLLGAADGTHKFVDQLTKKGVALGLEGRFRLIKGVDDMPAALMVADVVAMPSITPEPFGRVALEAQAMGRPVIAFNHGGAAESIQNGVTGWLAEPGDADSLAAALRTALSLDAVERATMANTARTHIEKRFSTARMCKDTIAVYKRLLAKAAMPDRDS